MLSEERKAAERLAFTVLMAVLVLFAASWLLPQVWDKLSPFIVAVPLAAMLQPVVSFCERKLKIKRGLASIILVLLLLGMTIGILIWLIGLLVEMVDPFLDNPGDFVTTTVETMRQAVSGLMTYTSDNFSPEVQQQIGTAMNDMVGDIARWGTGVAASIASYIINLAAGLPYFIIYISFLAMALFFVCRDYSGIRSYLPGGKRRKQDSNTTRLTNSAIRSLIGYLRVQGTFSLMVLVVSLAYLHAFGFRYASAIAILAGVMEMVPMIGSGLPYILMSIILFLSGNVPGGVQILVLTGVLQLLRRLLEPKMMSNSIGISPLEALIGMFAGMRFGGILGLIGGPVLMSVLVGAFRGKAFEFFVRDFHCIASWFRKRWQPEAPGPEEDLPEPEPGQSGPPDLPEPLPPEKDPKPDAAE